MGRDLRKVISYDNVNTFHPQEEKFAASIFYCFPFLFVTSEPGDYYFQPRLSSWKNMKLHE
jgi:hypothetical protein